MSGEIVSFKVKKDISNLLKVFIDGNELNKTNESKLGLVFQHFLSGEKQQNSEGDKEDIAGKDGEISRMAIPDVIKSEISTHISGDIFFHCK